VRLCSKFAIVGLSFVALFVIQTTLFSNSEVRGTVIDDNKSPMMGNENTDLTSSTSPVAAHSITHLDAKNTQEAIYSCATGDKGVIIPSGHFKITADKKSGKWTGSISIVGATGEKSGLIKTGTLKGSSYAFNGNLNAKNTLCHFPGLQMGGTTFDIGTFTCGTVKNVAYKELSTGNTNTFKVRINCK
jgi:hypothetical protein